jgi:PAS domain S-box-containing protein
VAEKQAQLETANELCEAKVVARTAALKASESEFRAMFELAGVGKVQLDAKTGRFVRVNRRFCELLGYSHEALSEMQFSHLTHPDDRDQVIDGFRRLAQRVNSELLIEIRLMHRNGITVWAQLSGTALFDVESVQVRILAIVQDFTDRKRAEEALLEKEALLRQQQKLEAVGSLAGGIAHEFNNLLQVIQGYTRFAQGTLPAAGQPHQDLEQVLKAAARAATLTRQLLSFSRREVLDQVKLDHRTMIDDLTSVLRPLVGEQIELTVCLAGTTTIVGDPMMLQQMLLHVCLNARDAMPSGGRLKIQSERVYCEDPPLARLPDRKPGPYLLLSISDTGCGMTPEVMQRVFEPFFTTKGVGKGTGLGLAMVHGIVEQHHGFLDVASEPGVGTTFRIYLPIVDGDTSVDDNLAVEAPCGRTETVLIAEDDPLVRDLAVRTLTRAGYAVLVAADGGEAVNQFDANQDVISLALLDVVMPKQTGHEVSRHMKLKKPNVEVIFCSGHEPDTGEVKCLMDQGLRIIRKPYEPDVLLRTVREALDARHQPKVPPMPRVSQLCDARLPPGNIFSSTPSTW